MIIGIRCGGSSVSVAVAVVRLPVAIAAMPIPIVVATTIAISFRLLTAHLIRSSAFVGVAVIAAVIAVVVEEALGPTHEVIVVGPRKNSERNQWRDSQNATGYSGY